MKHIDQLKKVYCIGLGGVGVSAVAKLLLARGVKVIGSDPVRSPIIDDVVRLGGEFYDDEKAERITPEVDLVITTDDAPADHPLRLAAARLSIPVENFSVTLGRLMAGSAQRICVAGTNGKSTTTALTGLLLAGAGLDPTVVVGSRVSEFDGNVRIGQSPLFVTEADEYRDHFLNYAPTVLTLTNLEPDHLDYFGTVEKMQASYSALVKKLPPAGVAVVNADDPTAVHIAVAAPKMVTFGIRQPANLQAVDISQAAGRQTWTTMLNNESLGKFSLELPGEFNIMNVLAAMAGALAVGADPSTFAATIQNFHGVWRRFQILNPSSPVTIISDYAHHPTAVRVTLAGARTFYPGRRLVAVFQPHHQSRLSSLFDDFTHCFTAADEILVVEAYTVPGRDIPETKPKTSRDLVTALVAAGSSVAYASSPEDAARKLQVMLKSGDVAIIMGAGDIWRQAEKLGHQYA